MRLWPDVLVVIHLSLTFAADARKSVRAGNKPIVALLGGLFSTAVVVLVLAYGGFWAPLGWSP